MTESKKLNPNWKNRISEIGKQPFELEEMLKLGFLKLETDKDKKIVDKAQKKFNEDIELLNTKEKEINTIDEFLLKDLSTPDTRQYGNVELRNITIET